MPWEKFEYVGRSFKPKASLYKNGIIAFSSGATHRFNLDEYEYAVLFYDKQNKRIGVKPTKEDTEDAVKLRERQGAAQISARSFLDYYDIPYGREEVPKYDVKWNEEEQMLILTPQNNE